MERKDFNYQWTFYKQGSKDMQVVNLPHDAMIHEPRTPDSPGGSACGFFPGGVYIYEKVFMVPEIWIEKCITFAFEGVYKNSKVYINGKEAGGCAYGYSNFYVSADSFLKYGNENTIKVIADNSQMPNTRWYSGSGIYRPVFILIGNKSHIEPDGVRISTLSYTPAKILVETKHTDGDVDVEILYGDQIVAEGSGSSVEIDIPSAKLWSDEAPNLYQCHVTLLKDNVVIDEVTEVFGIRKVEWSNQGLIINGKETLLRGGCVHHDNGILGACTFDKAEERRVYIMKEAGYNAIRSSHNPSSRAMLEACDKYGMYVMDETWDMWYFHKNKYDYATDFEANFKDDIKAMVERDYNHPSVIMYSIANEISEPREEKGVTLTKEMVNYIHLLDQSRAVTAGVNLMIIHLASKGKGIYKEEGGLAGDDKPKKKKQKASGSLFFNMMTSMVGTGMNRMANSKAADKVTSPCLDALDIAGYNYASGRYKLEGKKHPDRVIVGSETFPQDIARNWAMVKKYPYLIGDFMWTSWDYLGEAGIGAWAYTKDGAGFNKEYPWMLADVGAIDIIGNVGAEAFFAATVWGLRKEPYIGVRPVNHSGVRPTKAVWRGTNAIGSWSWKNCEGSIAEVEVYADAARVELLLNGKTIGMKKIKAYKAMFRTRYASGTLTAVAYDAAGKETGRSELISASGKTDICVVPEDSIVKSGEIVFVKIELVGQNGILECNDDHKLTVTVDGGSLLAFGSARPRTEERFDSGSYTTYYGRALAVVSANKVGHMTVSVSGAGLQKAVKVIEVSDK